jgi:CheY-like chemotaxis protein
MPRTTNSKPVRILIIEDNDDHWLFIEKAIHMCFPEVAAIRVASAERALTFLEECLIEEWQLPRLILQDLYLPNLEDGLTFLRRVKAMPFACRQIPIVMLSSSAVRADIVEAYQAGISSYCLKPPGFEGWIALFKGLRVYWLETVALPRPYYSL